MEALTGKPMMKIYREQNKPKYGTIKAINE
jgi:hypothetical protein